MVRYIKQRDHTSCGPVAVINILKWLGYKVSYDSFIHSARYLCGHEPGPEGGTNITGVEKALKHLGVKKRRVKNPSLDDIDRHIDSGGIVLLEYVAPYKNEFLNKGEGHFSICIGRTAKTYILVNDGTKNTIGRRSRMSMKIILFGGDENRYAWMISKPKRV